MSLRNSVLAVAMGAGLLYAQFVVAQTRDPILISEGRSGFAGGVQAGDGFGSAVTTIGDLDGNGIAEILVGANRDSEAGFERGSVYVLFLSGEGFVINHTKLAYYDFDFPGMPEGDGLLGSAAARFGDTDQDGIPEVLVASRTTIWSLHLDPNGAIREAEKIFSRDPSSPFASDLQYRSIGVLDVRSDDRMPELALGEVSVNGGGQLVLVYRADGSWNRSASIPGTRFTPNGNNFFGAAVDNVGDVNSDGFVDVAVGAPQNYQEKQGGTYWGAIWIFLLKPFTDPLELAQNPIEAAIAGALAIDSRDEPDQEPLDGQQNSFGEVFATIGDLDRNGFLDVAVSSRPNIRSTTFFFGPGGNIDWRGRMAFLDDLDELIPVSMSLTQDIDNDGAPELLIGAPLNESVAISFGLPEIEAQIKPNTNAFALSGRPVELSASIRGTVEIEDAKATFRPSGYSTFFSGDMVRVDSFSFATDVPPFFLGDGGVEYTITTERPPGRFPRTGVVSIPARHPDGLSLPIGRDGPDYELIAVPLVLDSTSARYNFEDDLGPYDITRWRMFEYDRGAWSELNDAAIEVLPGKGLALHRGDENRRLTTGAGRTVFTDRPFAIPLEDGWNLIGNPFAFDVPIHNLATSSDEPVSLWTYDGTWTIEDEAARAFKGYAIRSVGSDTLMIDPDMTHNPDIGERSPAEMHIHSLEQLESLKAWIGPLGILSESEVQATDLRLRVYPNPLSPNARVDFHLSDIRRVSIDVFDPLGRRVLTLLDETRQAGTHSIPVSLGQNGLNLAPGLYIVRVIADGLFETVPVIHVD